MQLSISILVVHRIGSAFVGVYFTYFHLFKLSTFIYISAGKGLIKKLDEQIVYCLFYACIYVYDL